MQPISTSSVECLHDNTSQTNVMEATTFVQEWYAERNKVSESTCCGSPVVVIQDMSNVCTCNMVLK